MKTTFLNQKRMNILIFDDKRHFMNKITVTLLVLPFLLLAFKGQAQSISKKIKKVQWLQGDWKRDTNKGKVYESWGKPFNNEINGKSYKINDGDTLILETIRIVEEEGKLYYIPTVSNQNEGKPVRFTMTKLNRKLMRFENPDHDFPQVISYFKQDNFSLIAKISATNEGKTRVVEFSMERLK